MCRVSKKPFNNEKREIKGSMSRKNSNAVNCKILICFKILKYTSVK